MELLLFIIGVGIFVIFGIVWGHSRNAKLLATVTCPSRGTKAEKDLILKLLKSGILAGAIFHDLYVRKRSGDFSQIDAMTYIDRDIEERVICSNNFGNLRVMKRRFYE